MPFGSGLRFAPSFTWQPQPLAERVAQDYRGKLVVDLGAGGRRIVPWVQTVDFVAMPGTDHVCDFVKGHTPFQDGSVDLVIATGVLEHVEDDRAFLDEIRRILKVGGKVHIEIPFLQQYHDDPIDCRRYTQPGLALLLSQHGFRAEAQGAHIGPTVTILTLTSYYLDLLFGGRRGRLGKLLGNAAFVGFTLVAWPLRYLDRWLINRPTAHRLAFGVYCTAVKATPISTRVNNVRSEAPEPLKAA